MEEIEGMITIFIENKPFEVMAGRNLLDTCLELGFDIPYFCWHPALGSVGACRQCAVKLFRDDKDTKGKIVMSCMTPAAENIRVSVNDPEAVRFRASVIEWLMLNHPHDCPVCDEGGECHLQDMTVMTGHVYRRTRFRKRTYRNQEIGPLVNHEMNRCIQCYRCVRYYREFAGGLDLNVFSCHDSVYFGRFKDGPLESEFSGNLVEVCPTGVFTDKTMKKHYTRPWDLEGAPSLCVHCGVGCNTIAGGRNGRLLRMRNRYNSEVNGYFLCDRGRYGYDFANGPDRIRKPVIKTGGVAADASKEDIEKYLHGIFHFGARAIGIGSPTASLESNFALRTLVGPDSFYTGMSPTDYSLVNLIADIMKESSVPAASLEDMAHADAVLILGENVPDTAPLAALATRQASRRTAIKIAAAHHIPGWNDLAVRYVAQDAKTPMYIATPSDTRLDDAATATYRATPGELADLGFAIAKKLDRKAPSSKKFPRAAQSFINTAADSLMKAERPLIISGTGCGNSEVIKATANIASALVAAGSKPRLGFMVPDCNSMGLALMGGNSIAEAFSEAALHSDTLVILECDLDRLAERAVADTFLSKMKHIIMLDCLPQRITSQAELLLPAAPFSEADGTLVNYEARAQRFHKVFRPAGDVRESWRWLADMLRAAGNPEASGWDTIDDINKTMSWTLPLFGSIQKASPPASFRISGMKVPRQPHRYSGRTAMFADISVHEPQTPEDIDSPLSFSMEGYEGMPPASLVTHYWAPGWNSVQALFGSGDPLKKGDCGIRLIQPSGHALKYFRQAPAESKTGRAGA
jgi:NADH-quinone oxidoreductase subunit G